MEKFISIRYKDGKYHLKEPDVKTFDDRNRELFGYPHVRVTDSGQFLPDNDYIDLEVGKFKVLWITDNWLGRISRGYSKITQGYPVYVFHKGNKDDYYLVKEYQDISSIEKYFEILEHYQNFKAEEYMDLMLGLASTCARIRDLTGVNRYLAERDERRPSGFSPHIDLYKTNGADALAIERIEAHFK